MIDYFLQFNTESSAIEAATGTALGQFVQVTSSSSQTVWSWNRDFVLPGVQAWLSSRDVTSSLGTTHTFLPNWYALAATKNPNATLLNHPSLAFALDRDGPPYVIRNNIGATLTSVGVQPTFAGSHYPMGGISS